MVLIKLPWYCYVIHWYHDLTTVCIFRKGCCLSLSPSGSGPRLRCPLMFGSADESSHLHSGNPRAAVHCPLDSHARLSVTFPRNTPRKMEKEAKISTVYCHPVVHLQHLKEMFLPNLRFPRPGIASRRVNNVALLFIVLLANKFTHRKS